MSVGLQLFQDRKPEVWGRSPVRGGRTRAVCAPISEPESSYLAPERIWDGG